MWFGYLNILAHQRFKFLSELKCSPYLYLVSGRALSLCGGGEALRSESDSDTGLRGFEEEEEGRVKVQFCTGEDRGFGRAANPGRALQEETIIIKVFTISNLITLLYKDLIKIHIF